MLKRHKLSQYFKNNSWDCICKASYIQKVYRIAHNLMVNSEILIISLKIDYDFLKFKEMVNIKKTLMESSFFYIILKLNLTFYLGKVYRTA